MDALRARELSDSNITLGIEDILELIEKQTANENNLRHIDLPYKLDNIKREKLKRLSYSVFIYGHEDKTQVSWG